ncbi:MAG: hypothetical protein RL210_1564 [Pseudomonadota bacterium]|jgi:O-antigen ligase
MHSIAVRNVLVATLLIGGFLLLRSRQINPRQPSALALPAKLFLLLSGWLLLTVLIAEDKLNALDQYRGEWLLATLGMLAGWLVARLTISGTERNLTPNRLLMALTLGLAMPTSIVLANAAWEWLQTGALPLSDAPLYGRTSASMVNNTLYGLLLADILSRTTVNRRLLAPLPPFGLLLAWILSLVATYVLNTRNGTLCILLMTLLAFVIYAWRQRHRLNMPLLLLSALLMAGALGWFGKLGYNADPRWAAFSESIQLSLDTNTHRAWLDDQIPLPLMSNGQPVDHSAYMRMAWLKEGAQAVADNPLGVGFGRNAFGHAMKLKYGIGTGHSHSSLIDFTLSGGIPGLLLWLTLSAVLMRQGWRAGFLHANPAGLALLLLIAGALLRMVIDSNLRDHGLEQYLFQLALLTVLAAQPEKPTTQSQVDHG